MNITLVAVAVIIILAGVVTSRSSLIDKTEKDVLSVETSEQQTTKPEETIAPTESPTLAPTQTPTPTQAQTPPSKNVGSSYSDWRYPNSVVVSEGSTLVLSSSDNADTITDWYKSKVESGGFNVKSFVKTSANDVVKNVISAANGGQSLNVEINKDGGDVRIKVEISSL